MIEAPRGGLTAGFVGSRAFTDKELVRRSVERLLETYDWLWVCSGRSPGGGLDILVQEVCAELGAHMCPGVPEDGVLRCYGVGDFHFYEHVPKARNREAYFARNSLIVRDSNVLFAFYAPGPRSPGTNDSVKKAIAKKIPVYLYHEGAWEQIPAPKLTGSRR